MTIKDIYRDSNMIENTYVTIWDFNRENLLYCGTAKRLTVKMLNWEIWLFNVTGLSYNGEYTDITDIVFILESGEEKQ